MKTFTVEHLGDVSRLLVAGYQPSKVYYYAQKDRIRFIFEDVNGAADFYFKIKRERQDKLNNK